MVSSAFNSAWVTLRSKISFVSPLLVVIIIAGTLAYGIFLADITVKAIVFAEEGGGVEAAAAGILNALMYIIPAIVGGFIIALLVKYRKKLTIKYFFTGVLFFATTFIVIFFGDAILYVIQTKLYTIFIVGKLEYLLSNVVITNLSLATWFYYITIPFAITIGFFTVYSIFSLKSSVRSRNLALLLLGGLMGAFLAVILPTWTVLFMLIGLSLYDIYSVKRGPIRDIVESSIMEETNSEFRRAEAETKIPQEGTQDEGIVEEPKPRAAEHQKTMSTNTSPPIIVLMTYSSANWDLGIGDLVFYSMLTSHALHFGASGFYLNAFGLIAPWLTFLGATLGIILGFLLTVKLLARHPMLPGLPVAIGLGLAGFGLTVGLMYIIAT